MRPPADRGSVSLEAAVIFSAIFALVAVVLVAGRIYLADLAIQGAADSAARAASISRTGGEASSRAASSAAQSLQNEGVACQSLSVTPDLTAFQYGPGTAGSVNVTVQCVVNLSDVGFPGLPGSYTATRTGTSPLDTYRGRE